MLGLTGHKVRKKGEDMLKKLIIVSLVLTFSSPFLYAGELRDASGSIAQRVGQTILGNLLLVGGPGEAPGYIALKGQSCAQDDSLGAGSDGSSVVTEKLFYLWIDSNGCLRVASETALSDGSGTSNANASPPTTYWSNASGPKIAEQ